MTAEIITIACSAVVTALITFSKDLREWYNTKKKAQGETEERENKHEIDIVQQAFTLYKDLIVTLTKQVEQLSTDIRNMEQAHVKCQEENASMRAAIQALKAEVEQLAAQLKEYEKDKLK